jgi:hypothetical protein
MIVVHTYVPARDGGEFNKELAYHMTLSMLLAKEQHGRVDLYTTKKIADLVKKFKIPYDNIITEPFDGFKYKTFSIPKLITFSLQTEPFIHIDLDTMLYDKVVIPKNLSIIYHSPSFFLDRPSDYNSIRTLYDIYLKGFFGIEDKLSEDFKICIDFTNIPGMDIFGGTDYETISKAAKMCLKIYEENKEHFDSNYFYACVIEQLFMPAAIKLIRKGRFADVKYLKNGDEVLSINQNGKDIEYPIIIKYMGNSVTIPNEEKLYNYSNHDFGTPLHLGEWKSFDVIMFILKETIIERFFGSKYVNEIEKHFKEDTGFNILSKRYKIHKRNNTIYII